MTPYATELLAYIRSNMPKGIDCEAWLDENVNGWRERTEQPKVNEIVIEDGEEE